MLSKLAYVNKMRTLGQFSKQTLQIPGMAQNPMIMSSFMQKDMVLRSFGTAEGKGAAVSMDEEIDPQEAEKIAILKQKRILRRYLRLKRNNYSKNHAETLTDAFLVQSYLPKIQKILEDNSDLLKVLDKKSPKGRIIISSYSPISYELNINPVMQELMKVTELDLINSLPVVEQKEEPLVFREYTPGDELVKSELFSVYEPKKDKEQVYPQVLIVPLMGFMDDCHRIGYGGGFYDRTIEQLREMYDGKMLMIGVAFEAQKFDRFTGQLAENDIWKENANSKIAKMRAKFQNNSNISWVQLDTDEPLDYIITEKQIYQKDQ